MNILFLQNCKCSHNTCGEQCTTCCPLFNQRPWQPGNSSSSSACIKCQCFGHASKCRYDPEIAEKHLSLDTR